MVELSGGNVRLKYKIGTVAVIALTIMVLFAIALAQKPDDTIYSLVKLSSDIAFKINARYVDDVNTQDMIYAGIRGMLDTLDPFSEFLDKSDFSNLTEMTSGKYSGLGMTIFLKDSWVTVLAPMEGTPAYRMGLRAGDRILKIDGKTTQGMSTQEASKRMRGDAGTKVALTIHREGIDDPMDYNIERAVITIKTVPFSGVFEKNGKKIGYVRLSRFGEEADAELETAMSDLAKQDIDGLIFDLRSNGGGLLSQAVNVANYFLPKGSEVTYTKGRTPDQDNTHYATRDPMMPKVPLVVLVNEMSASASEIVAGAIQDSDRGVLIGNTTFGKGLVQQVYTLTDSTALKLTTAKWYVPSGRCIQKDSHNSRHPDTLAVADSLVADTAKVDSTKFQVFHTNGGRIVYGGGGITPDIKVSPEMLNPLELNLERLSVFFDYAMKYTTAHPNLPASFEVTDQMVSEFKDFLKEKKFTYKNRLETAFDDMEKVAKDSTQKDPAVLAEIDNFKPLIDKEKENEFNQSIDYIKRSIKRDILTRLYSESEIYQQIVLKTDPYVQKAVDVLTSQKEYVSILEGDDGAIKR
jgi:carboxyl-terminal processing protease